jgi:hypothetical protein
MHAHPRLLHLQTTAEPMPGYMSSTWMLESQLAELGDAHLMHAPSDTCLYRPEGKLAAHD